MQIVVVQPGLYTAAVATSYTYIRTCAKAKLDLWLLLCMYKCVRYSQTREPPDSGQQDTRRGRSGCGPH
jgi:hypothetical protein